MINGSCTVLCIRTTPLVIQREGGKIVYVNKAKLPPSRVLALYNVKDEVSSLSYLKKSLNPTIPVLPIGIFRYFWAIAYVCIGASPNRCSNYNIMRFFRVESIASIFGIVNRILSCFLLKKFWVYM